MRYKSHILSEYLVGLPITLQIIISFSYRTYNTSIPGLNLIDLSLPILIESTSLPNYEHRDPADRLIIASTRSNGSHLMTVDEKIIDYAKRGYLKIVATYD